MSLDFQASDTGQFFSDGLYFTSGGQFLFPRLRPLDFEHVGDDFFILAQDSIFRCRPLGTGIVGRDSEGPEESVLLRNYPNPFNPSTTIAFRLEAPANVVLAIYDLTGREVVRLVDGNRGAGEHTVTWDGKNAVGVVMPTGQYLYRLRAGSHVANGKMLMVK